ncbi:unnamed protein product [Adineta steineri]|uniref:Uncharacterized protein n=1 Tax=Adineta steineri TaxID=433720 RepID=A0A818TSB2_9BILA|nr:unnamed protein product [Adineta steineri]
MMNSFFLKTVNSRSIGSNIFPWISKEKDCLDIGKILPLRVIEHEAKIVAVMRDLTERKMPVSIVNVSSEAAVDGLICVVAMELGPDQVRVSLVCS